MEVVIMGDHLYACHRIWQGIRDLPEPSCTILVCNNRGWSRAKFIMANIYLCFFRIGPLGLARLVANLCRKELRLRISSSHLNVNQQWLTDLAPDVGLHAMSVIYRKKIIESFHLGILNPHIGKLPEYRGRCVMEWSILHNSPTGITTFIIDEGIDTGKDILFFSEVDIRKLNNIDKAKEYLFSQNVVCFRKALIELASTRKTFIRNDVEKGRRFYVMSDLFKDIVERILAAI